MLEILTSGSPRMRKALHASSMIFVERALNVAKIHFRAQD